MTLTQIMIEELKKQGPGQHATEPFILEVYERCQREGLPVTMQDVRREFRDAAGYP